MEFFKPNTKIQFMKQRKYAAMFSALMFVVCIVSFAINGLNLGLDFTGGTQVEVTFQQPAKVQTLRESLHQAGFVQAVVQSYGAKTVSVRVGEKKGVSQEQLKEKLLSAMPGAKLGQLQFIGPQVGKQLMTNGILAIIVALLGTMIYIAMRFEVRFAVSAAIALIHDPVLVLGIFSFFHIEFNLIVLSAVLTVIGYSLNDTIVVYDRVRENFCKIRKGTPLEIMDLSINNTLSRTIMTSGLTLVVVIALYLFGGPVVHGFALALIIGIVIGTYSSIYVAGSAAIALGLDRTKIVPPPKKVDENEP